MAHCVVWFCGLVVASGFLACRIVFCEFWLLFWGLGWGLTVAGCLCLLDLVLCFGSGADLWLACAFGLVLGASGLAACFWFVVWFPRLGLCL